jgi:NADH-quinone oxidoreductase subunit L
MTAFYTARAYFLTFWGEERIPEEAGHHAHESPPVMTGPLLILAAGAAFIGLIVGPLTHWFSHGLVLHTVGFEENEPEMNLVVMGLSVVLALLGVAAAWWMYVRQPGLAPRLAADLSVLYQMSVNKFHLDELYYLIIVRTLEFVAAICRSVDYLIDTLCIDFLVGRSPFTLGAMFRPVQNGLVQFYALAMILGMVVFLLALAAH